jgi:aspartate/methionine/tyrosine aminotransferase
VSRVPTARRLEGVERTLIRRIFDSAPARAINLGLGQPDLPTPPSIALAGIAGIVEGRTGYTATAGEPGLRAAVAELYPAFGAGPDSVVITVGTQEAMFVSCLALLDPGDEVLYPDPGYPAYPVVARLVGAVPIAYPLHVEDGFRIRPEEIERRLSERTRAVIVSEPSNPTGAITPPADRLRLARRLAERGVTWISDEIYAGFSYDGEFVSLGQLAAGGGLVISGLSKDRSMAGWRIGWIAGPPPVIERIIAAHQYLVTCASSVSQQAARVALGPAGRAAASRYLERFRRRRERMAHELARLPGVRFALPDGAFYFFVDVSHHGDSLELSRRILERREVIVIPGEAFGERGRGFLRISFAASESAIAEGLHRIGAELGSGPLRARAGPPPDPR